MADAESTALAELLAGLAPDDEALRALLDDLARIDALRSGLAVPAEVLEVPAERYVKPAASGP